MVEHAIATADGAEDLQTKLQHLHVVLQQPYQTLNDLAPLVLLGEMFNTVFVASRIVEAVETRSNERDGVAVVNTVLIFAVLFWPVRLLVYRSKSP